MLQEIKKIRKDNTESWGENIFMALKIAIDQELDLSERIKFFNDTLSQLLSNLLNRTATLSAQHYQDQNA